MKDGPNILDDCAACPRMFNNICQYQQIAQPGRVGDEVRKCLGVPAYDGWYPYIDACSGCLSSSGTGEFWGQVGRMMYSIYWACRGDSDANVTSGGLSLCATEIKYENCISLKDGSEGETWVSFRGLSDGRYDSNQTHLLNLAPARANLTTSTTAESAASKTAATTTAATGSDTTALTTPTTTPATGTGNQAPSTTAGSQSSTTTANSSFAGRLSQGSQAGYVLGMVIVAGIVGGPV